MTISYLNGASICSCIYLATFVLTCNDSDMRGDVFLFVLSAVKIIMLAEFIAILIYVYNHVRVVIFNSHKNNHITLIIIVFLLLAGDEQEPAGQEIGKTKTLASCNTDHLKET